MIRTAAATLLAAVLCVAARGQARETPATFEISDVHASPRSTTAIMRTNIRAGRYELRNATMVDLIRTAYDIDADKILDGPAWLEYDRFDLSGKTPVPTPPVATLKVMLQGLLADRFKLKLHRDTRPVAGFVLSLGKGKPKLKESDGSAEAGCKNQPQSLPAPTPGAVNVPLQFVACHNMTMEAFAATVKTLANVYITNTVTDSTGLKGTWDFDLKWTQKALLALAGSDGISIFDAIDKQLGLKLEEQKIPTAVIVVDEVNEKPTDNAPDLAKEFPPAPAVEFEVADIKLSAPLTAANLSQITQAGFFPGGRVYLPFRSLSSLITLAWNISNNDIVNPPRWLNSTNFDITAKAPAEVAPVTGNAPLQELAPMLQSLLIDRFKMKSHFEDRPVDAYTLVAAKPKLKKSTDPSARTGCKSTNGPAPAGAAGTPFGILGTTRIVTCQNMTMAQFADQLQILAGTYLRYPVVDATGIEGGWNFSFTFSLIPANQLAGLRGAPPAGAGAADIQAAEPVGGTSLFDAVEKQLGLRLEVQKRPYPGLVIDHIEEKPTEN